MLPGLAVDRAPPISVPLRFLLVAPLFLAAAGLLLLAAGAPALEHRLHPVALALTHLVTLGFLTMVMMGALFQVLPVVVGAAMPNTPLVVVPVHVGLVLGAILLSAGLAASRPGALLAAAALLGTSMATFIAAAASSLASRLGPGASGPAIRAAVFALLLTSSLGITMTAGLSGATVPVGEILPHHMAWGLVGWVAMLLAGVAVQVVPMFQVTPPYPAPLARWLGPALFVLLATWSTARQLPLDSSISAGAGILIAIGLCLFALATLRLQAQRRRRIADSTVDAWRFAMLALLAAGLLWIAGTAHPPVRGPRGEVVLGVLVLVGFGASAVTGMLYKIVPLLIWLHLRARTPLHQRIPSMRDLISERAATLQVRAHSAAAVLVVLAAAWPGPLARPAGLALAISAAWLAVNLTRPLLRLRRAAQSSPGTS